LSKTWSTCVLLMLVAWQPIVAQANNANPCEGQRFRQFDFWLGDWKVYGTQGQHLGDNTISLSLGGCALHEAWRGASGGIGFSYSIYDRVRDVWHQSWVDNSGNLLLLDGAFDGTAMILEGSGADANGPLRNRLSWTPLSPDSVRQHWEVTRDGGASWTSVFDGMYVKTEPSEPQ